jgi:hypothetical protein
MPISITIRSSFLVPALLEIEDPEFLSWYSLGMYWSMFGDCQERGPFRDHYIMTNIELGILNGWYVDRSSGWFPMVGFKLGMLHGGWLNRPAETLVILTDPDFRKGYQVGRNYHYTEALPEGRIFSDRLFNDSVYEWALGYHEWSDAQEVLRYCLGCRIGELSATVIPDISYSLQTASKVVVH